MAAEIISEAVVMDILQGAAGKTPDPDTCTRCFACLASFFQRAELLEGLVLDLSLLATLKKILAKLRPEVDRTILC